MIENSLTPRPILSAGGLWKGFLKWTKKEKYERRIMKSIAILTSLIMISSILFSTVESINSVGDVSVLQKSRNNLFSGGDGIPSSPYRISNIYEFQNISTNTSASYIIMNDIDASSTMNWNDGSGFSAIGNLTEPFQGVIDGNNYNISNLYIKNTINDSAPFQCLGYNSKIINLNLMNVNISSDGTWSNAGGISISSYGLIQNCSTTGKVFTYLATGGISSVNYGRITRCWTNVIIYPEGYYNRGGISGINKGTISHCYTNGSINGFSLNGGIAGQNQGIIESCNSTSEVNGQEDTGGIVGNNNQGSIKFCIYFGNISGTVTGGIVGKNTGSVSNCISNGNISGKNPSDEEATGGIVGIHQSGQISSSNSTMKLSGYGDNKGGIVGTNKAMIRDCHSFGDISTTYSNNLGGFVGTNNGGNIEECSAFGNISGSWSIGGFVGRNIKGSIKYSFSCGRSIGYWYSGGFVGKVYDGSIDQCYSYGDVICNLNYAGGFVGMNLDKISNSFSMGNVKGVNGVGGFVSWNEGDIENCYSTGKPNGTVDVCGFSGRNNGGSIIGCFYDNRTSQMTQSQGGMGRNTTDLTKLNTIMSNGWLYSIWNIIEYKTYPFLRCFQNNRPIISGIIPNNIEEDQKIQWNISIYDFDKTDINLDIILISNATFISYNPDISSISGSTTNDDVGIYWLNLTVNDGRGGSCFINTTFEVLNLNDNPSLSGDHKLIAFEDCSYEAIYTPFDIDPTNDEILFIMKTNATWLNFNSEEGRVYGTPEQNDIGVYWVNLSLDDGNGGTYWDRFEIEVQNTNDAPYFITQQFPDAIEDEDYELLVEVDDIDPTNDIIIWEVNGTNLDILQINKYSGLITFQPGNDDVGEYWALISISDGQGGYVNRNYTLNITNINDDPVLSVIEDLYVTEDEEFHIQMEGFDIDSDSDQFIWSLDPIPSFIEFNENTGNLTGLPLNDDVGEWEIEATLSDGDGGKNVITFKIFVASVNDPPVTTQSIIEVSFEEDSDGTTIDLNEYTDDEEGDELYFFPGNSLNLTIQNDGGILSISPKPDYEGIEEVIVEVYDGSSLVYITLIIEVTSKNDPPVIIEIIIPHTAKDNETITLSCLAEDIEGDTMTFTWISNISGELGNTPELDINLVAGLHKITLIVEDEQGSIVEKSGEILVENSSPAEPDDPSEPVNTNNNNSIFWIIGLVLLILLLAILGATFYFRQSKDKKNEKEEVDENPNQLPSSSIPSSSPNQNQPNEVENEKGDETNNNQMG